jgi:glutamate synthase (NADPH/NADH) small chain
MKIPRTEMPIRDGEIRKNDFDEVPLGFSLEQAIVEASRCINCGNPHCVEGCPVNIDIPGFLKALENGDMQSSINILMNTNQLPAICGRVCPQDEQCEAVCIIGKKNEPVAIGNLERFVADYAIKHKLIPDFTPTEAMEIDQKIAIAGSGPAGLTVAAELRKLGYKVKIFEALHKAGGVLFYGIPRFRLPADVIDNELNNLKKMGVEIELNALIGRTYTIDGLFEEGYDAVMVGTGAGLPKMLGIPGENLKGVFSANEFLTRVNLMRADKFPEYITPVIVGKDVVIVGAGNTAMDACRTAMRFHPNSVTVVYRRSREEAPARTEEILHAEQEGIKFLFLNNPVEMIGDDEYNLKEMKVIKMELGEPDEDGRRRPITIKGSEYNIKCDMMVSALGFGVNPLISSTTEGIDTQSWGAIKVDENGMTTKEGVFAAGDIITGGSTVIMAMGQAKTAAVGIDKYLRTKRGLATE